MQLSNEIKQMNMADKFAMMEMLWENMSQNIDDVHFTPQWHLDMLEEREKELKNGQAKFYNINVVKERLQKKQIKNYNRKNCK